MTKDEKRSEASGPPADESAAGEDQSRRGDGAALDAYQRQADAGEAAEPSASEPETQIAELEDLLLRKAAEFDNYRKRARREREEFARFANSSLIEELLPVLDSLELALGAADGEDRDSHRRGVELTLKQFLEVLGRSGLSPIPAVGEQFDPSVHEAVIRQPTSEHPEGVVIEELQRGYRLNDRVLRPSRVKVAAAPEDSEGEEGDAEGDGPVTIPIQ